MRLVGIKSAEPGSVLSIAVYTSSGKAVLNAGVVLTEAYLEKLRLLGINKIYIEDERFEDVEPVQSLDTITKNNAIQVVRESHQNLHKDKPINEYVIKDISKSIVDFVRDSRDKGASILSINAVDDYIIEHTINVALLSAFLGNRMNFNYNQLCDMVTGALIHDLDRENVCEEKPEHTQKGFDVMRKCRGFNLHSSIVCYEHHEKFDGTGYPRRIKGQAISEFTRLIQVADAYDNFLHGYNNQNISIMPHLAYEHLLAMSGTFLDSSVVEQFRD
ncbi:MAG TPA: HD domain-containing phosphohydrolase, partial [Clostridia bacterium]|nr:HD domain-containing phosphohydrolase [Clostridia bacterium]